MQPWVNAQVMESESHDVLRLAQAQPACIIDMVRSAHRCKRWDLALIDAARTRPQHSPDSQHTLDQPDVILYSPRRRRQRVTLPALPFQACQPPPATQEQPVTDRPPWALFEPLEHRCEQLQTDGFVDRVAAKLPMGIG